MIMRRPISIPCVLRNSVLSEFKLIRDGTRCCASARTELLRSITTPPSGLCAAWLWAEKG